MGVHENKKKQKIKIIAKSDITLRCLINEQGGRGGGVKNKRGRGESEIFLKFNKQGEGGGVGISKNPLISVMNGKRYINI